MSKIFTPKFLLIVAGVFMTSTALSYVLLSDGIINAKHDKMIDDALGLSVDGRYQEAFNILKPLSDQGVTRAQLYLATAYYHGNGVEQNLPKAVFLFLELQDKNYEPGIVNTYLNLIGSMQRR